MQLSFREMQKIKKPLNFLISTEKETKCEKIANPADFRIKKFLFLSSTFFSLKKKKLNNISGIPFFKLKTIQFKGMHFRSII